MLNYRYINTIINSEGNIFLFGTVDYAPGLYSKKTQQIYKMNRRQFIKTTAAAATLPGPILSAQSSNEVDSAKCKEWSYRVYCFERAQGEWIFSQNIRGSFDYRREYFMNDTPAGRIPYCGWMDQGKLHFQTLDDATDFVDMHVKAKNDVNLIDSIYDIYYVSKGLPVYDDAMQMVKDGEEREIKVAHYWFNGDTGRQIEWVAKKPYTDWSKIECA